MNYRPIGGEHGPACDDGDWEHMCDECRTAASNDWEWEQDDD
jgi:hypothetical protein